MNSPVSNEIRAVGENLATILARVPLNSYVNRLNVAIQIGLLMESLIVAQLTDVAFYRAMGFWMIPELLSCPESSFTKRTCKVSLLRVRFPMGVKIAGRSEEFTTDFALILSFIIVNAKMQLQISGLGEATMANLEIDKERVIK